MLPVPAATISASRIHRKNNDRDNLDKLERASVGRVERLNGFKADRDDIDDNQHRKKNIAANAHRIIGASFSRISKFFLC